MKNTIKTTNYIKGISIVVVMISHFIPEYFPSYFSSTQFTFWGNHFVSFFFIVSGYGLSFSMNKLFRNSDKNLKGKLVSYYTKRLVRIWPLYICWFFSLYRPQSIQETFMVFLGIDFIEPPVWFYNAILQCYIIGPLIYYLVIRFKISCFFFFTIGFLLVNAFVDFLGVSCLPTLAFRSLFFLHIYFFAVGMLLPMIKTENKNNWAMHLTPSHTICCGGVKCIAQKNNIIEVSVIFILFLISCDLTADQALFFSWNKIYIKLLYFNVNVFSFVFIALAILLVYKIIYLTKELPLSAFVEQIGKYSFPLYLFHGQYFYMLNSFGIISKNSLFNLISISFFFPIFLFFCMKTQLFSTDIFLDLICEIRKLRNRIEKILVINKNVH